MKYSDLSISKQGIYESGNTCYIVLNKGVESIEGPIYASPHLFEGERLLLESNDRTFLRKSLPTLIEAVEFRNKQKLENQTNKGSQTKPKFAKPPIKHNYNDDDSMQITNLLLISTLGSL